MHDSLRALAFARARAAARDFVDVYRQRAKTWPALCTRCGATEWRGLWRWDTPVPDLAPVVCPACERIRDGAPAHTILLTGEVSLWWHEVKALVTRIDRLEQSQHPLERVMRVEVTADGVVVTTTGVHAARRLVASLRRRWRHGVRLAFGDGITCVEWVRAR